MSAKRLERVELGVENDCVWGVELVYYFRKLALWINSPLRYSKLTNCLRNSTRS